MANKGYVGVEAEHIKDIMTLTVMKSSSLGHAFNVFSCSCIADKLLNATPLTRSSHKRVCLCHWDCSFIRSFPVEACAFHR